MSLKARFAVVSFLLVFALACFAQDPAPPAAPEPTSVYALGTSYNAGGSPAVAGTGLYAHKVNDSGTYAFTVVDALPATLKPFTVTTNFGFGVAQKVVTLGKVPIYIPTSAGVSWNGNNTGWSWTTGALAAIKYKDTNFRIMPNVRIVKSSVSGGTGYQPIVGVLFGWGQ